MTTENLETPGPRFAPFKWADEGIGRIAAPIRAKLLIAFLGSAVLMIALALTGVAELRKANLRTAEVINLNIKIAGLNNLGRSIHESMLAGTGMFVENYLSPDPLRGNLKAVMRIVSGNVEGIDRPSRFGDIDQATEMKLRGRELEVIGNNIIKLYYDGEVIAARTLFDNQLRRGLRALDREVRKLTFDVRLKMREQAKVNEVAYQRSRQLVLGASGLAATLALALGYLISASIIHPVERIRVAMREVSSGDFNARAEVANRDELGDLAESANNMTLRLSGLYDGLETANKHKSDFLANMSHELRTPLNAIIGFTRIVMRKCADVLPQKQFDNLGKVMTSAEHLLSLINGILDLSKIESGRMEVHAETFEPAPLLKACLQLAEPLTEGKPITVKGEISGDLPRLSSDQDMLRQITLNLLSNAAKFTEKGEITLKASALDGRITIAVEDTGIGIDQENLSKVFDEFSQAEAHTARKFGGTGLGLTISRKMARLLQGDITVTSKEGVGSTFSLTLPIRYVDVDGSEA